MAVRPETYSTFFHKIIDVHFLLPLLGLSFEYRRMNGYTLYVLIVYAFVLITAADILRQIPAK